MFASIEAKQMFIAGYVAKLVGEYLRMANEVADCAMGMTEDPIVDIEVLDVVRKVSHKRAIDTTAGKLV